MTRNLFDLTAIPIVQRLSHLPMIADPSHGTGLRDKVIPMARAAVAAGADGVIVEVHPTPDRALSDGGQSLYPGSVRSARHRASRDLERDRPRRWSPTPRNGRRSRRVAPDHETLDSGRGRRHRRRACRRRAAGAQSVDATIDRAVAAWAKVKTVRGTFEQTVTNSLTGTSATSRGDYVQERPNRLAIRFTQPAPDAIVADGKVVWVYLPSEHAGPGDQAAGHGSQRGADRSRPASFSTRRATKYDITAAGTKTVDGHAAHGLMLVAEAGHRRAVHQGDGLGRR